VWLLFPGKALAGVQVVGMAAGPPVRTSETHPITLSCVLGKLGEVPGKVGMCYCPGKEVNPVPTSLMKLTKKTFVESLE